MDTDEVVKVAAQHSWEAALLVVIVLAAFTFIGWMLKRILAEAREREARMAERIDRLEDAENQTHVHYNNQLNKLTEAVTTALVKSTETQAQLIETMGQMTKDMRELCTLLKSCPCLLLKDRRGTFKILDEKGQEIVTVQNGTEA